MIGALVISQVLLAAIVVMLAIVCFALARQIGVLHERIAPAGALSVNQRLKVGDAAPAMTLVATDGQSVSVGAPDGKSQLYFFPALCIKSTKIAAPAELWWLALSGHGKRCR